MNVWMKHDKTFAPLRRVIKQKNFDISQTVEELEDIASNGLIAFSDDIERIEQFLDSVHEKAVSNATKKMKKR